MVFKLNNSDLYDGLLSYIKKDVSFKYPKTSNLFDSPLDMIIGPQVQHNACVGNYNRAPSWLEISFGNRYIIPYYYSMQGRICTNYNNNYLKSWELEGKMKNGKWVKLHNQTNNPFSFGSFKTFPIESNVPIKSLRINMTDKETGGTWWICMGHFDVYGCVISSRELLMTCRQLCNRHNLFYYYNIIMLTHI